MSVPSKEFVALDRTSTEIMLNRVIKDLDDNTVKGIVYILTNQFRPEFLKELESDSTPQEPIVPDVITVTNEIVEKETKPYTYPPRVRDEANWPFMRCKNVARKLVTYDEKIPRNHHDLLIFLAKKFKLSVEELKATDPITLFRKKIEYAHLCNIIDKNKVHCYRNRPYYSTLI